MISQLRLTKLDVRVLSAYFEAISVGWYRDFVCQNFVDG
jgi:hypothetical protein